jgi:hypothetical protein
MTIVIIKEGRAKKEDKAREGKGRGIIKREILGG